jgi:hypothetical protein
VGGEVIWEVVDARPGGEGGIGVSTPNSVVVLNDNIVVLNSTIKIQNSIF